MPKQTFLNLPEQKRQIIINAAVDEFAGFGFDASSINRIVANSKISKGSFYQYFEDKMDVFKYLMDLLTNEKIEFFKTKHPPVANMDTFDYFRWMVKTGMEFNSAYPRMTQAVTRVLLVEGLYYGKNFIQYHQLTTDTLSIMIRQAMKNGEVDPSVDVELAVMEYGLRKTESQFVRQI